MLSNLVSKSENPKTAYWIVDNIIRSDNASLLQVFLQLNRDSINTLDSYRLLILALHWSNLDMIRVLVDETGCDINAVQDGGVAKITPLFRLLTIVDELPQYSSKKHLPIYSEICTYLLNKGADPFFTCYDARAGDKYKWVEETVWDACKRLKVNQISIRISHYLFEKGLISEDEQIVTPSRCTLS